MNDSDVRSLVVDFIIEHSLEVFVAFALNFQPEKFAEHAETLKDCRQRYWSQSELLENVTLASIDAELLKSSKPYRTLVEFFRNPFEPQFRGLLEAALNDKNLGLVYNLLA